MTLHAREWVNVLRTCIIIVYLVESSIGNRPTFTNEWAVCVDGGMQVANDIARRHGFRNLGKVASFDNIYKFVHVAVSKRVKRNALLRTYGLIMDRKVLWSEQQVVRRRVKRMANSFDDKRWKDQWYLYRREIGMKGHDMNVLPAWEKGVTGKGVVVSILDDGIEYDNPELAANYDPRASYDYNSNDPDPRPMWTLRENNGHGTRCAAEVAAVANNSHCIVGVAYDARIGGIRMLDGDVTDLIEAQSLSHQRNYIDVYSASWGPEDDGKTVDGPGNLTKRVLEEGALKGRGGKGNIFVWASGNGGPHYDNCNCDGYTNSIYTISVSTATDSGGKPWYLESCASSLVTTYGTGRYGYDRQIVTADVHSGCTSRHTGTSVGAPFIAGCVALALQVKPSLNWRDVQHLIVNTANLENLDSEDFQINGAGRRFSHRFGFGMVDCGAMASLAEKWHSVSEHHVCRSPVDKKLRLLNNTKPLVRKMFSDGCQGSRSYVRYLEHVHVIVTLSHSVRGSVSIHLVSPSGTRSNVLAPRAKDDRRGEFREWAFMSTHFWGEDPHGLWTIEISSGFKDSRIKIVESGFLEEWKLVMYGTECEPGKKYQKEFKQCHEECELGCSGPEPDQCVKCKNFAFQNQTCVSRCPLAYYKTTNKEGKRLCKKCHSSCRTCDGDTNTDCTSCYRDMALTSGICRQKCAQGSFWVNDKVTPCRKCDSECAGCFGIATNCTACRKDKIVHNGKCISECQEDEYFNGKTCSKCHGSCNTCSGPGPSNCTSCHVTKLFGFADLSNDYLLDGTCLSECPDGYFPKSSRCERCPANCKNCIGGNTEDCNICNDGFLKVLGENSCVLSCPTGHYVNFNQRLCEPCVHTCEECVPGRPEECLHCSKGYVLKGSQCVFADECDFGFYANYSARKCELCPYPCAACNGIRACTSCALNLYVNMDGRCVERCSLGSYLNDTFGRCMACHERCKECSGPSPFNCTACRPGEYVFKGRCVRQCPRRGYYSDKKTRVCKPCYHSCAECRGPAKNQCTKCIKNLDLRFSTCFPPCIDKYLSENSCRPCAPSCRSCFGPSAFDCLSCFANYSLNPATYSCSKTCPPGYFKPEGSAECKKCHPSCRSCSGDTMNDCLSCAGTLTYFNGSCTIHCPIGYYISEHNKCKPCRKECGSCLYKPDLCTTCKSGYVLNDYKCKKRCSHGNFLVKNTNRCFSCHRSCDSCSGFGANECTSCKDNYYLWNSICLSTCPPGFQPQRGRCISCESKCSKCSDDSVCVTCKVPYVLHKGRCVLSCPDAYAVQFGNCVECHSSCSSCFGVDARSCLSCKAGYLKTPMSSCETKCPPGTFENAKDGVCEYCHEFCKTCNDATMYNCTSCGGDLLLNTKTGACIHECDSDSYADNGTCNPCHATCQTCNGGTAVNCTACKSPEFVFENHCVDSCPFGTYEVISTKQRICSRCHRNCHGCHGAGDNNCLHCAEDALYHFGQCLDYCPGGFYMRSGNRNCVACPENCFNCSSPVGTCLTCMSPYILKEDKCMLDCEAGFYYNSSVDECQECHATCLTCSSLGGDLCTSCRSQGVLKNGTCYLECRDNEFGDVTSFSCQPCHKDCMGCIGPKATDCRSCREGFTHNGTLCKWKCQKGYFYDLSNGACKRCTSRCLECDSVNGLCTRCMNNTELKKGRCLANCTEGEYFKESTSSCHPCPTNCQECVSMDEQKCLRCVRNFVLYSGQCHASCPDGLFYDGSKCSPCRANCMSCSSWAQCNECQDGWLLQNRSCIQRCPDGYYSDMISKSCTECAVGCVICNSSKANSCEQCADGLYLQNGTCVAQCRDEFTANDSVKRCSPVRKGPCDAGQVLEESTCKSHCSAGFFLDLSGMECKRCNTTCKECQSLTECTLCFSGFHLVDGYCRKMCARGYYMSDKDDCLLCPIGCLECNSNYTCSKCNAFNVLVNGKCSTDCPHGHILSTDGKACNPCPPNCSQCENDTYCHVCAQGNFLQQGLCVSNCSAGFFKSPGSNTCYPCGSPCSQCSIDFPHRCLTCAPGHWLHRTTCVTNCSILSGFYAESSTRTCEECSSQCTKCYNATTCVQCSNTTFLEDGKCTSNCSEGYRPDPSSGICLQCDEISCGIPLPIMRSLKALPVIEVDGTSFVPFSWIAAVGGGVLLVLMGFIVVQSWRKKEILKMFK